MRSSRAMLGAMTALVLLAAVAVGGCDNAGETFQPGADGANGLDATTGLDTAVVTDTATGPDVPTAPDVQTTPDIPTAADTPAAPDVFQPPAGALGGPCKPGNVCDEGECLAARSGAITLCTKSCFSNDECPANVRCEAIADDEALCLPGPRGTAKLGEPCGTEMDNGCESALCIDADPAEAIHVDTCTDTCTSDADCAVPYPVCYAGVGICLPILSGDLGGRCNSQGECVEGDCTLVTTLGERCTRTCAADAECGLPYLTCQEIGLVRYCLRRPVN